MKIVLILIAVAVIGATMLYVRKRPKTVVVTREIKHGPFTIKMEHNETISGRDTSAGMVDYSVFYKDQPVQFPGKLQSNTGYSHLWRVYILEGTPTPTLLAGSQSLYLIREETGACKVEILDDQHHDFAKFQFLDAENGQPAPPVKLYMAQAGEGVDTLSGGNMLLIGHKLVVRLTDFKRFQIDNPGQEVGNYCYSGDKGVAALSPDQKSIVYVGNFQTWTSNDNPEHYSALVEINFETNRQNFHPLDRTALRLQHPAEIDYTWVNKFFEWKKEGSAEVLQPRKDATTPPWTGYFTDLNTYYHLIPAKEELSNVFLDFVLNAFGANRSHITTDKFHEYTGRVIEITLGDRQLNVTYRQDAKEILFSAGMYLDNKETSILEVQRIAKAFNAELEAGKYQNLFDRFDEN